MNREERRAIAESIAKEYDVPYKFALRVVKADIHAECIARSGASCNKYGSFVAAATVLLITKGKI